MTANEFHFESEDHLSMARDKLIGALAILQKGATAESSAAFRLADEALDEVKSLLRMFEDTPIEPTSSFNPN